MDDVDPDGGINTACMRAIDKARKEGRLITLEEEVEPGVFTQKTYMLKSN